MSYTTRDYLRDLGLTIRHRDLAYLDEWRYALSPTRWRCTAGIHRSSFNPELGGSYSEPGEPGYACEECGADVFPVRIRLPIWLGERLRLYDLWARLDEWRHPYGIKDNREWCLRHDKPWGTE